MGRGNKKKNHGRGRGSSHQQYESDDNFKQVGRGRGISQQHYESDDNFKQVGHGKNKRDTQSSSSFPNSTYQDDSKEPGHQKMDHQQLSPSKGIIQRYQETKRNGQPPAEWESGQSYQRSRDREENRKPRNLSDAELLHAVIQHLIKFETFWTTVISLNKLMTRETGVEADRLMALILQHPTTFHVFTNQDDDDEPTNYVELCPKMKVCAEHNKISGCGSVAEGVYCRNLHICLGFLCNICSDQGYCAFSHSLGSRHNTEILLNFHIHQLEETRLKRLLQKCISEVWPGLCYEYNFDSCNDSHCRALHMCENYARDLCDGTDGCELNHDICSNECTEILEKFGVKLGDGKDVILHRYREFWKRMILENRNVRDWKTPPVPSTPKLVPKQTPALSSEILTSYKKNLPMADRITPQGIKPVSNDPVLQEYDMMTENDNDNRKYGSSESYSGKRSGYDREHFEHGPSMEAHVSDAEEHAFYPKRNTGYERFPSTNTAMPEHSRYNSGKYPSSEDGYAQQRREGPSREDFERRSQNRDVHEHGLPNHGAYSQYGNDDGSYGHPSQRSAIEVRSRTFGSTRPHVQDDDHQLNTRNPASNTGARSKHLDNTNNMSHTTKEESKGFLNSIKRGAMSLLNSSQRKGNQGNPSDKNHKKGNMSRLCLYNFDKKCRNGPDTCSYMHCPFPYAWKVYLNNDWLFMGATCSDMVEKSFRVPGNVMYKIAKPEPDMPHYLVEFLRHYAAEEMLIDFEHFIMFSKTSDKFPVCRLSTPSDAVANNRWATVWEWYFDNYNEWTCFGNTNAAGVGDRALTMRLEKEFLQRTKFMPIDINGMRYIVDLKKFIQINDSSRKERKLRRRPAVLQPYDQRS